MVTFDIVIPSYGRPATLIGTLEAIRGDRSPRNLQKLIVVENGGRWGVEEICEQFATSLPINFLHSELANLSNARNIGIAHSRADIVLFLDNDVRVIPGALEAYARAFDEFGQSCFYGGSLYPEYETPPPDWLKVFLPSSVRGHDLGGNDLFLDQPLFLGGNFKIPRVALQSVSSFEGPCAEGGNGGGVGEENRLQERLLQQGFRGRYVAGAGIVHPVSARNSDVDFVIHRRYRHAYSDGFLDAHSGIYQNLWGSAPRYYWKCLLKSLIHLPLCLSPRLDAPRRLQYRLDYQEQRARIVGFREAIEARNSQ
jgi:glycosyltransferase involved in cell wall biosynthesis